MSSVQVEVHHTDTRQNQMCDNRCINSTLKKDEKTGEKTCEQVGSHEHKNDLGSHEQTVQFVSSSVIICVIHELKMDAKTSV